MPRVLVIADDLTGAAEIAGIGHRRGLDAAVLRAPFRPHPRAEIIVADTDSRLLPPAEAARRVDRAARALDAPSFDLVFKKVDSVLRGPVLAEVEALLALLGLKRALIVPGNPSRGRTIRGGEYRIDGVPLDRTAFSEDPDCPARTCRVVDLLGPSAVHDVRPVEPGDALPAAGILVGAGSTAEDPRHWASRLDEATLAAGAADFFQEVLERAGIPAPRAAPRLGAGAGGARFPAGPSILLVSASSALSSREAAALAARSGAPVFGMPDALFESPAGGDRSALEAWCSRAREAIVSRGRAVLSIPQPLRRDPALARRLAAAVAGAVARLLAAGLPGTAGDLLVEGGATAAAIAGAMGWSDLAVEGEPAPGIVAMRPAHAVSPRVTLKPGSYEWPAEVWSAFTVTVSPGQGRLHGGAPDVRAESPIVAPDSGRKP